MNQEEPISEKTSSIIRVRPPTTSPAYLVFHHGRNECSQTFFSLSDESYTMKSIPELRGMTCFASSHGWLVMSDNYNWSCYLLNPVTMEKVELPTMEKDKYYNFCVLTSSPHTPNCVVMFVDNSKCIFCRPGQKQWTKQDLIFPEDNHTIFSRISAATSCKGNIYISYWEGNGIGILDTTRDNGDGGLFSTRRAMMEYHKVPYHPCCDIFATFLVESCEDIFLVSKHSKGYGKDVFGFTVQRLNISTMDWDYVTNLGNDRVFLLSYKSCTSASASALGVDENCIYYFEWNDRNLYKFNMDEESISTYLPCPNNVRQWRQPYWMLPQSLV